MRKLAAVIFALVLSLPMVAHADDALVDDFGNTFDFRVEVVSDGTGHGTGDQCVGDDAPDDRKVCVGDTVTYRMVWESFTKRPDDAVVTFSTDTAYDWRGGGIEGGTSVGFTGSVENGVPTMRFDHPGRSFGEIMFVWRPTSVGEHAPKVTASLGERSKSVSPKEPVVAVATGEYDLVPKVTVDKALTELHGTLYQGLTVTSKAERMSKSGKGYADPPPMGVQYTHDGPDGTLMQIDGEQARVLVPWEPLAEGDHVVTVEGSVEWDEPTDNNRVSATITKRVDDFGFQIDTGDLPEMTMPDGTVVPSVRHPGEAFTTNLSLDSSGEEVFVCNVWDDDVELANADVLVDGDPLRDVVPDAVVRYTTSGEGCGPGVANWTTTTPEPVDAITGVAVRLPKLAQPTVLHLQHRVADVSHFDQLLTRNAGTSAVATTDLQTDPRTWIRGFGSVNVVRSSYAPHSRWAPSKPVAVGAQRVSAAPEMALGRGGAAADGTMVVVLRVDHCMLDSRFAVEGAVSVTPLDGEQDPTNCGTLSEAGHRVEFELDHDKILGSLQFTTPATSLPGDSHVAQVDWESGDGEYALTATPTQWQWQVDAAEGVVATQSVDQSSVMVGDEATATVGWFNQTDDGGVSQWVSILPARNVLELQEINYSGAQQFGGMTTIEYTKDDPLDDDVRWCKAANGGRCPKGLSGVTALRFTTWELQPGMGQMFDLRFSAVGPGGHRFVLLPGDEGVEVPAALPVQVVAGSIAGALGRDDDESGSLDTMETVRFCGQTVELHDDSGMVQTTTTSGDADGDGRCDDLGVMGNGEYRFDRVPGGKWTVVAPQMDGRRLVGDARRSVTVSLADHDHEGINFGYMGEGFAVRGMAWMDLDGNQSRSSDEVGTFGGVTARLTDHDGSVVDEVRTAGDGTYTFDGVPAGEYVVQFDVPEQLQVVPPSEDQLAVEVEVSSDDTSDVDVALTPTFPVEPPVEGDFRVYKEAPTEDSEPVATGSAGEEMHLPPGDYWLSDESGTTSFSVGGGASPAPAEPEASAPGDAARVAAMVAVGVMATTMVAAVWRFLHLRFRSVG